MSAGAADFLQPLRDTPRRMSEWSAKTVLGYLLLATLLAMLGGAIAGAIGLARTKGLFWGVGFLTALILATGAFGAMANSLSRGMFSRSLARQFLITILGAVIPGCSSALFLEYVAGAPLVYFLVGAGAGFGLCVLFILYKALQDLHDVSVELKARTLADQAAEAYEKGEPEGTEGSLREAVETVERQAGSRSTVAVALIHSLANFYRLQRQFVKAEALYLQVMPIYEQTLGTGHPILGRLLFDLATCYSAEENFEAGIPVVKRVLAIREKSFGASSAESAQAINLLAYLNLLAGKDQEALDLARRALTIQEKLLGGKHPEVSQTLATLANAYRKLRKYFDAENIFKRILDQVESEERPEPIRLALTCLDLAEVRLGQNKVAEAEPLYGKVLRLVQSEIGNERGILDKTMEGLRGLVARAHGEELSEELRAVQLVDICLRGDRSELRELTARHPDLVRWKDVSGWGGLQWAAYAGHDDLVRALLETGADWRSGQGKTMTAMDVAVFWNFERVIKELIEAGADWNNPGLDGQAPLHWAARRNRELLIDKLVGLGADVDRRDDKGRTPLHWAALGGHLNTVVALIAKGAHTSVADNSGQTPLHMAAAKGYVALVECLLINGSDPNMVEKNQSLTPLKLAQQFGHKEVVRALKKHMKLQ
ncbi:MAG: hypothetical protein AMXMBFR33_24570 [Candidatus Xenobia bacterium]